MPMYEQLLETYEQVSARKPWEETTLAPVSHMNANAQIEVLIDANGEFKLADPIGKNDPNKITLIPVTEESAGRSSGPAPHALCDMLPYVAGDFASYCREEKKRKAAEKKFKLYMTQLKNWKESEHSHEKVEVVYKYLDKRTLCADLIKEGVLELDENGFFKKETLEGKEYEKALVRFRINDGSNKTEKTWKDESLVQAYIDYYSVVQNKREDICYLTGKVLPVAATHPKGILSSTYGAKLISANDAYGFTYRGRFRDSAQTIAISYAASQKIHSALTYLVRKHGVPIGTKEVRIFICWTPVEKYLPGFFETLDPDEDEEPEIISYKEKLQRLFEGYRRQFSERDKVSVAALEAVSDGKLSLTYYQELYAWDFLRRLQNWGETCYWRYLDFDQAGKPEYRVRTPMIDQVVECAYGRERGKQHFLEVEEKMSKLQTQRLIQCMLESWRLPRDFMQELVGRASMPQAYKKRMNWEKVLSTACAVVRKYRWEQRGEVYKLEFDLNTKDRSYLYGGLLALLESLERSAYNKNEKREPNAIRYWTVFVSRPLTTWAMLEKLLQPYYMKLQPGLRWYYREEIGQIESKLKEFPEKINRELKETYILGYYSKRADIYQKKVKKEDKSNEQLTE